MRFPDDLLKAIGHDEYCRRHMTDAEIITTALVAALFFNGNHSRVCNYMKEARSIYTLRILYKISLI